jgi:transposase-like protein
LEYWVRKHRETGTVANPEEEKDLRKKIAQLERQVQRLTLEREILKKATAFFAREQP